MGESIIVALITAGVPSLATLVASLWQNRMNRRNSAKQSILQMIMEDQLSWELFKKFPVNYGNIQNEYEVYHKNGGNGEVTKKVREYNAWYEANEAHMLEMKDYSCSVEIKQKCQNNDSCSLSQSITTN